MLRAGVYGEAALSSMLGGHCPRNETRGVPLAEPGGARPSAVEGEDHFAGAQRLGWCDEAVHADPHARAFDPFLAGQFLEPRLIEPSADVGSDPEFPDVTPRDAGALRELKAMGRWV